jgi:hypothetical protein
MNWLKNVFISNLSTEIVKQKAREEARKLGKTFVDLSKASEEMFNQILENPEKFYVYLRIIAPLVYNELDPIIINGRLVKPTIVRILELPEIHGMVVIENATDYLIAIMSEWNVSKNIKMVFVGEVPIPIASRARHLFNF